jgi:hypothetical protein
MNNSNEEESSGETRTSVEAGAGRSAPRTQGAEKQPVREATHIQDRVFDLKAP